MESEPLFKASRNQQPDLNSDPRLSGEPLNLPTMETEFSARDRRPYWAARLAPDLLVEIRKQGISGFTRATPKAELVIKPVELDVEAHFGWLSKPALRSQCAKHGVSSTRPYAHSTLVSMLARHVCLSDKVREITQLGNADLLARLDEHGLSSTHRQKYWDCVDQLLKKEEGPMMVEGSDSDMGTAGAEAQRARAGGSRGISAASSSSQPSAPAPNLSSPSSAALQQEQLTTSKPSRGSGSPSTDRLSANAYTNASPASVQPLADRPADWTIIVHARPNDMQAYLENLTVDNVLHTYVSAAHALKDSRDNERSLAALRTLDLIHDGVIRKGSTTIDYPDGGVSDNPELATSHAATTTKTDSINRFIPQAPFNSGNTTKYLLTRPPSEVSESGAREPSKSASLEGSTGTDCAPRTVSKPPELAIAPRGSDHLAAGRNPVAVSSLAGPKIVLEAVDGDDLDAEDRPPAPATSSPLTGVSRPSQGFCKLLYQLQSYRRHQIQHNRPLVRQLKDLDFVRGIDDSLTRWPIETRVAAESADRLEFPQEWLGDHSLVSAQAKKCRQALQNYRAHSQMS